MPGKTPVSARVRIEKASEKSRFMTKDPRGKVVPIKGRTTIPGLPKAKMLIITRKAAKGNPNAVVTPEDIGVLSESMKQHQYRTLALAGTTPQGTVAGYTIVRINRPIGQLEQMGLNGAVVAMGGPYRHVWPHSMWDRNLIASAKQFGLKLTIKRKPMPGYQFDAKEVAFVKKE